MATKKRDPWTKGPKIVPAPSQGEVTKPESPQAQPETIRKMNPGELYAMSIMTLITVALSSEDPIARELCNKALDAILANSTQDEKSSLIIAKDEVRRSISAEGGTIYG